MNSASLLPSETIIIGRTINEDGKIRSDKNGIRIGELLTGQLIQIGTILGDVLYRDPQDGRAWECAPYLSVMGGGPGLLHAIPDTKVDSKHTKYNDPGGLEKLGLQIFERNQRFLHNTSTNEDFELKDYETMISAVDVVAMEEGRNINVKRIEWLVQEYLALVGSYGDDTLFFDAKEDCYWELVNFDYPSQALGGGYKKILPEPRVLHCVDGTSAKLKYNI